MTEMLFSGWQPLIRIAVVGVLAYVSLVIVLRITGKRTLSKLNAFDLVITVSLGSCLATVLLSKDIALSEGILAFTLLCGLQFLVTWSSVRSPFIEQIVKSEPTLLFLRGEPLHKALKQQRVTVEEIQSAVRSAHGSDLHAVDAVVLETDGTLSVIKSAGSATQLPALDRSRSDINSD